MISAAAVIPVALALLLIAPNAQWESAAEQRAEEMGIEVVYTDSPPCKQDGCAGVFDPATPDRIYIRNGTWHPDDLILHELAHVQQFRDGAPLDECEADEIAKSWGAEFLGYAELCQ